MGKDATHPLDTRMKNAKPEHNKGYVVDFGGSSSVEDQFFDLISSYGGKGLAYGLTCWAWLCLLFYFITSSDSGSLVIDIIGANGEQEPPILQRIFWAVTEGCAAIALLKGSQGDPSRALGGVQAVSRSARKRRNCDLEAKRALEVASWGCMASELYLHEAHGESPLL